MNLDLGYKAHPKQREFHESKARFRTVVAGMRFGKTVMGAVETIRVALEKPRNCWVVAPTHVYLQTSLDTLFEYLYRIPHVVKKRRTRARRVWLTNGSVIEWRSADEPDSLRGPGLDWAWLDEAAKIKVAAAQLIRTRISDRLGRMCVTTTPRGKDWVYKMWMKGQGENKHPDYQSFHFPTRMNPFFPKSELAELRNDLPATFYAQEYEAKFLDDAGGVFRGLDGVLRDVDAAVTGIEGPFALGVDWAKHEDWTVVTAMAADGTVVDWLRMQKVAWPEQLGEVKRLAEKWHDAVICHDQTGLGDPLHDELVAEFGAWRVKGIKFTTDSRRRLVQSLQSAIESRLISVPRHPVLVDELKWFEYKKLPSGNIRYDAPAGQHDDCVFSLALANWARVYQLAASTAVIVDMDPEPYEPTRRSNVLEMGYGREQQRAGLWRNSRLGSRKWI